MIEVNLIYSLFKFQESGTWKPQASKKECGDILFERDVGGTDTYFGQYPFMALLGNEFLFIIK